MFELALKRLFLILFPLSLLFLALFLANQRQSELNKLNTSYKKESSFFKSKCPFYLGVSFFPIEEEKKYSLFKRQKAFPPALWTNYLLSEQNFAHILQNLKDDFKKEQLSFKKILFVFPLALTKEGRVDCQQKNFYYSPDWRAKRAVSSHLFGNKKIT